MAERHDLTPTWLNHSASAFRPATFDDADCDVLIEHPRLLMAVMMITLVLIGTALDLTPTILIFAPVMLPIAVKAGIDPVYFGLMFVLNGAIGLITPPVGTVLNVVAGVARLPMHQVIRGVNPFLFVYALLLALFTAFPQLVIAPVAWMR